MSSIEQLNERLEKLLTSYEQLKSENESLRTQSITARAECEAKGAHIEHLEEQLTERQNAVETMNEKIRQVLDL